MEPNHWDYILQSVAEGLHTPAPMQTNLLERPKLVQSVSKPQILTPPDSTVGSPEQDRNLVSVSTTFYPGADVDLVPADICMLSSDSVFFYVHSHRLLAASSNNFDAVLPSPIPAIQPGEEPQICVVPEDSAVTNILLHTIYNISAAQYSPPMQSIVDAVEAMTKYGMSVKAFITPSTPLFLLLSATAVINPIEIYTLAASFDIPELAEVTSTHLLSYSLPSLPDDMAMKMGPAYLKRLFFLHLGRVEAFKRLLLPPPTNHVATAVCDVEEQQKLTRAWTLASAYLAWEAKPDLNTTAIESALCPLADHLTCEQCKRSLKDRVMELVMQWAVIKVVPFFCLSRASPHMFLHRKRYDAYQGLLRHGKARELRSHGGRVKETEVVRQATPMALEHHVPSILRLVAYPSIHPLAQGALATSE